MRRFSWLYLVDCAQRLTKASVIAKNVIDAVPLSEHQFQRELHFSRIERAGNHTEIRRPENPSRQIEVCMIESVGDGKLKLCFGDSAERVEIYGRSRRMPNILFVR